MKLRNKKTGKIDNWCIDKDVLRTCDGSIVYNSLAELNEDWEDVPEEPKGFKSIGTIGPSVHIEMYSKEEAEKAVEKLKARTRLEDKGFRFTGWTEDDGLKISICTNLDGEGIYDEDMKEMKKDLDICFGGEE